MKEKSNSFSIPSLPQRKRGVNVNVSTSTSTATVNTNTNNVSINVNTSGSGIPSLKSISGSSYSNNKNNISTSNISTSNISNNSSISMMTTDANEKENRPMSTAKYSRTNTSIAQLRLADSKVLSSSSTSSSHRVSTMSMSNTSSSSSSSSSSSIPTARKPLHQHQHQIDDLKMEHRFKRERITTIRSAGTSTGTTISDSANASANASSIHNRQRKVSTLLRNRDKFALRQTTSRWRNNHNSNINNMPLRVAASEAHYMSADDDDDDDDDDDEDNNNNNNNNDDSNDNDNSSDSDDIKLDVPSSKRCKTDDWNSSMLTSSAKQDAMKLTRADIGYLINWDPNISRQNNANPSNNSSMVNGNGNGNDVNSSTNYAVVVPSHYKSKKIYDIHMDKIDECTRENQSGSIHSGIHSGGTGTGSGTGSGTQTGTQTGTESNNSSRLINASSTHSGENQSGSIHSVTGSESNRSRISGSSIPHSVNLPTSSSSTERKYDANHNNRKNRSSTSTIRNDERKELLVTSYNEIPPTTRKREQEVVETTTKQKTSPSTSSISDAHPDFLPLISEKRILTVNNVPYVKLGVIGKGGSCKVYKTLSKGCSIVAIKKVKLAGCNRRTVEGYANEIALLRRLRGNPAIIQLYDSQVDLKSKAIYLVMESGEVDLNHVLRSQAQSNNNNGTPSSVNMNFIRLTWQQMLSAVHCIHEERIIHGDLKPANFLFVKGVLKLIDFGIAKAIQCDDTTNIYRESQVGTLNYMSPESIQDTGKGKHGHKCGKPSDVWSLGCILYQMCYGRTPFADIQNMIAKLQAIVDPSHDIEYPKTIEKAAIDAIKSCLQRQSLDRAKIVGKNGLLNEHYFLHGTGI